MSGGPKAFSLLRAALLIDYASLSRAGGISITGKPLTVKDKYCHLFPCSVGVPFERAAWNVRQTLWILLQRVSLFRACDLWSGTD
jgi:hypothetical protein